ncbi:MAG TPA: hypothetical protein VIJ57_01710 [Hanamia sp.]
MKKLLLIGLLFQASFAFSQAEGIDATYIKDSKTYGYIQGVRLDSLDMGFATFGKRGQSLYFDYGQGKKDKEMFITDKNGLPLMFPSYGRIFWLNFFYYNGWVYVPDSTINLLKKRK